MKRITTIAFILTLILALAAPAVTALNEQPASITVIMKYGETLLNGIEVSVCKVADAREDNGHVTFDAVTAFAGANANFTDLDTTEKNLALAAVLDTYADTNSVTRATKPTGSNGRAVFNDLSAGLYLIAQMNAETSEYIIAPYLVLAPNMNEMLRAWDYDVTAYPKTEPVKRSTETVPVGVYKIWSGTDDHPDSVTVQLYRNSQTYGSVVTLDAGNNWSHTWHGLNPDDTWTVDETGVPAGYTKAVSGSAKTGFVITNTKIPDNPPYNPPPYDGPKTEDTGNAQLWIMLIAFGCAGLSTVVYTANSKRIARIFRKRETQK